MRVCAYMLIVIHSRLIRYLFFYYSDKRNRREMTMCPYCAFLCTCMYIVCLRFPNYGEKHEISVYTQANNDDDDDGILYSLPAYLSARVCTVTGQKLVSIMRSDRRDGNIRGERNIELDEKSSGSSCNIVSYGSGRRQKQFSCRVVAPASAHAETLTFITADGPCFLDNIVVGSMHIIPIL